MKSTANLPMIERLNNATFGSSTLFLLQPSFCFAFLISFLFTFLKFFFLSHGWVSLRYVEM